MAFHDKIDWTGVDWTRTNAEIAASLGGIRRETVSRERVRLGHTKVYPKPSDRIGELERENAELRAKLTAMTAERDYRVTPLELVRAVRGAYLAGHGGRPEIVQLWETCRIRMGLLERFGAWVLTVGSEAADV